MESHPIFTDGELDRIVAFCTMLGGKDVKRHGSTVWASPDGFATPVSNRVLETMWNMLSNSSL